MLSKAWQLMIADHLVQWSDVVSGYVMEVYIHEICPIHFFLENSFVVVVCTGCLVVFQFNFSCFIAFLSAFISILSTCVTGFVVCFIFPAIVSHVYFPTENRVSKYSPRSTPPEWCLSSLHVGEICKSCVSEGKEALVLCHALLWVLQSLFVFRSAPQQYPTLPAHTLSHTHCAQSSLRKQATAITRAQTGAVLYRKTCSHFPGSWLTHHCPIIHYTTWKTPKSQENNTCHFLAPLHKTTLWI